MLNKNYILNFGPQHPAAHGVLRLILELDGEKIISADPHIGFLHRGTEKLLENKTFQQGLPYFDRLDYVSMLTQEHGFILAVEQLLGINIPLKAQIIRTLFDELTRLLNHIMCITTHALDVGALTPFLWGFEERERLLNFYEEVSGARMHASYYRFGGLSFDISDKLVSEISDFSRRYYNYIDILDDLLSQNPIWLTRLVDVGVVSKKDSVANSFSGPIIRGSGMPWDKRKTEPYEIYSILNFTIPVGLRGDSYSRYFVRLMEMRESLKIIDQCVELLNYVNVNNVNSLESNSINLFQYNTNSKYNVKSSMEELIHNFKNNSFGLSVPKGEVYTSIEAPKGETGVYVVSDNSNKPYRCKIKSPGFLHLQGINFISKNFLISDLVTNIGSLDIVFGEIDR